MLKTHLKQNLHLYTIFLAYLVSILVFGSIYFIIYQINPSDFAFANEILNTEIDRRTTELATQRKLIQNTIGWINYVDLRLKKFDRADSTNIGYRHLEGVNHGMPINTESFFTFDDTTLIFQIRRRPEDLDQAIVIVRTISGEILMSEKYQLDSADIFNESLDTATIYPFFILLLKMKVASKEELQNINRGLKELSSNHVWRYPDFLYFSCISLNAGFGDIAPNSRLVRIIVSMETIINWFLLLVLINSNFKKIKSS
jgi:hypothetical protein